MYTKIGQTCADDVAGIHKNNVNEQIKTTIVMKENRKRINL